MPGTRFGYVIVYVAAVGESVDFYQRAFGLELRFLHESGAYAEMESGATALAFADESASPKGVEVALNRQDRPSAGIELAFVVDDVEAAYQRAVDAGAEKLQAPKSTPWGQVVAYVRDAGGVLVELCSAIER